MGFFSGLATAADFTGLTLLYGVIAPSVDGVPEVAPWTQAAIDEEVAEGMIRAHTIAEANRPSDPTVTATERQRRIDEGAARDIDQYLSDQEGLRNSQAQDPSPIDKFLEAVSIEPEKFFDGVKQLLFWTGVGVATAIVVNVFIGTRIPRRKEK